MEARGEFTIEGCIEMAWIMGFIKHFNGKLPDGSLYVGWVDAKSSEPVDNKDVKAKYEADILAHSGICLIGTVYAVIIIELVISLLSHRTRTLRGLQSQEERLQPKS